ncbi:MAG: inner membrane CreD family protein, partial [Spirochaetaceae bacterium]|nr:inner membrane CreD family protein [Spirochaetaceae bacterium]
MLKISRQPGLRSALKAIVVIMMLLLMLIPLSMIRSQVNDRELRADEAARGIIDGAGGSLEMIGPLLVIPYELEVSEKVDGELRQYLRQGEMSFIPELVSIDGVLDVDYRVRGIYRVPVYSVNLETDGGFVMPGPDRFPDGAVILTGESRFIVGIGDMRGIREVTDLMWNGLPVDFGPDGVSQSLGNGITAGLPELPAAGSAVEFSWAMDISGGGSVSVTPLGRDSKLSLAGNWPSPSFQGAMLPDERQVNDEGFTAHWRIPEVSRPIKSYWDSFDDNVSDLSIHALRVELLEPVGAYARTERSVKYGALFLLIPFVVFFMFETLGGLRVHPVQYLLAG